MKKTAALILGLTLTVGATGCNFFPTDSEKDLAQVVATVDISSSLEKHETYDKAVISSPQAAHRYSYFLRKRRAYTPSLRQ